MKISKRERDALRFISDMLGAELEDEYYVALCTECMIYHHTDEMCEIGDTDMCNTCAKKHIHD